MQKKIFILCLALSLISFVPASHAQKGKSEFSLAYGYWSAYTLTNLPPYNVSSGTGILNYKYYFSNKFTLGINVAYENISNLGSYFTVAPEFSYAYMDTKNDRIRIKLYGSGSFGLTVFDDYHVYNNLYAHHSDESGAKVTGHASPFGIRIGRKFAGFMELGFGYKGLVNGGLCYRFRTASHYKHQQSSDK